MILKSIKRNSEQSNYIALISGNSINICELILSQFDNEYKLLHIKEINFSIKLYADKFKWIELL